MPLCETITDLTEGAETLRRRRYGVIEFADGRFRRVALRPFPKIVSAPGALLLGGWYHEHRPGDRLRLYYNQPWRFSNFLVLKYIESARDASLATVARAGRARCDRPTETQRRIALRRLQRADHHQVARPIRLDAALPLAVASALHQAILRQLSRAAGVAGSTEWARMTSVFSRRTPREHPFSPGVLAGMGTA